MIGLINERKGTDERLCPDNMTEMFIERIVKPYLECLWHDGAPPPSIKGFKAHIQIKPGAVFKNKQPYSLSQYDMARLSYQIEEEVAEGKLEKWEPGEKEPPCVTPVFIVDKKGSLIGRKVGAYQFLNEGTEDYYHPAADADAILKRAAGRRYHTVADCVWGFSGLDTDDETALLLAQITHLGVFKVKKLGYGPKQGPGIYQSVQDAVFGE